MTQCVHRWARKSSTNGHLVLTCEKCCHCVDWTAAREEYERLTYDPSAGMIDTPHGPGRWVGYDACRQIVVVEIGYENLVEYPAASCYLPVPDGGRLVS